MAFNNGFPMTYPQMYYPQYQQPIQPVQQQQPAQNNGIIWVQGEAGAKSYLVAPNTTVQLWDSERQTIYLKSADSSGMPSMKILDYNIRDQANVEKNGPSVGGGTNTQAYATKADFDELSSKLQSLQARIDGMTKEEVK